MRADTLTLKLLGMQERGLAAADEAAEARRHRDAMLAIVSTPVETPGPKAPGSRAIGNTPTCLEHLTRLVSGGDGLLYGVDCSCVEEPMVIGGRDVRLVVRRDS